MKIILSTLMVCSIVCSCNQPNSKEVESKAPVDSLISNWENSWNKHDSAGVSNMFLSDALLIDDQLITENSNDLSTKWIHPNINVVSNLKSTKLQEWSSNDRAGYTGKYEFDVVVNDAVVANQKGVYTVNWNRVEDGGWKISTANIHSFAEP